MNRRSHTAILALTAPVLYLCCLAGLAVASSVTTPTQFQSNTPALASEVNANFAAHEAAINDNDGRLTALEGTSLMGATPNQTLLGAVIAADGSTVTGGAGFDSITRVELGVYQVTFPASAAAVPTVVPVLTTEPLHIDAMVIGPASVQWRFKDAAGNAVDVPSTVLVLLTE